MRLFNEAKFLLALCSILFPFPSNSEDNFTPQSYFVPSGNEAMPELANQWWQWLYGFPKILNPRQDTLPTPCPFLQSGDVWFLADAEHGELIKRQCKMPVGKSIFFPVLSNIVWTPNGTTQTCDEVKELTKFDPNPRYQVSVSLDGVSFPDPESHRIGSRECFDLYARVGGENRPQAYPSATDGYWFLLRSLPVGSYELSISANYLKDDGSSKSLLNIIYEIEVVSDLKW